MSPPLGALQPACSSPTLPENAAQLAEALLDIGEVDFLRTFSISRDTPSRRRPPARDLPADPSTLRMRSSGMRASIDRLAAEFLVKMGEIPGGGGGFSPAGGGGGGALGVAIGREHERARDSVAVMTKNDRPHGLGRQAIR